MPNRKQVGFYETGNNFFDFPVTPAKCFLFGKPFFVSSYISLSENSSLKLEKTNILAFSKNAFKTGNKISKNMSHPRVVEFL